jgi:hypothetical protein
MMAVGSLSRTWPPTASPRVCRREIRKLLLETDQQLSEQPRELGLLLLGQGSEHPPLGLEVTRSHTRYRGPSLACEGDEKPSAVFRVAHALDEPGLLEAVDEVRHPAGCAHQGPVQLGRRTPVWRADTPEGSQGIPTRPVQSKAAEVLVHTTVEQGRGATDPRNDRDRRRVESGLFPPPLCEHTVDMVSS